MMMMMMVVRVVAAVMLVMFLLHSCLMPGFMSHVPLGPDRAVRARSSRSQPSVAGNGWFSCLCTPLLAAVPVHSSASAFQLHVDTLLYCGTCL
jgi:hypothetical protein